MSNVMADSPQYDSVIAYFDEMNLLPSEKKKRIATAKKFQSKAHEWFLRVYDDIKSGYFMHEKTDGDYIDDLIAMYIAMVESVDKTAMYDTDVNAKAMRFATQVHQTNQNAVNSIESDDIQVKSSIMLGIKIADELMPQYLKYSFGGDKWGDYRSEQIAEYETNWIYNYLTHKKKVEKGQLTHTWETMKDERVRGTHAIADGQTVPINQPFVVGGYKMLFPCDDSLGAPASEILGCRCLEI